MNPQSRSTSAITTNIAPSQNLFEYALAVQRSIMVTVEYMAIAANGKRITGVARAVYTNVAGTATILGAQIDPYLKKDASGFADNSVSINATGNAVHVDVTQPNTVGDTNWGLLITFVLL